MESIPSSVNNLMVDLLKCDCSFNWILHRQMSLMFRGKTSNCGLQSLPCYLGTEECVTRRSSGSPNDNAEMDTYATECIKKNNTDTLFSDQS